MRTAAATERFGVGVELFGTLLPIWTELLIVTAIAAAFLALSIRGFSKQD